MVTAKLLLSAQAKSILLNCLPVMAANKGLTIKLSIHLHENDHCVSRHSVCTFLVNSQQSETYFLSQPSLTPDGSAVVFSYEGDIWKANTGVSPDIKVLNTFVDKINGRDPKPDRSITEIFK